MARTISIFLVTLSVGCGGPGSRGDHGPGNGTPGCSDADGDGYGTGQDCLGLDCNDSVPVVHSQDQCDQFCADNGNMAPGCACNSAEPEICYFGGQGTLGVGACR